jgi:hypothetical protein
MPAEKTAESIATALKEKGSKRLFVAIWSRDYRSETSGEKKLFEDIKNRFVVNTIEAVSEVQMIEVLQTK